MSFDITDYMKGKRVSETRARQDVVDKMGRETNWWLTDFMEDIVKKAGKKSDKKGMLGDWGKMDWARKTIISLIPGGKAMLLADEIIEKNRKQKDYERMIKNIEAGKKIPLKYQDTFAENQLLASVDQATGEGIKHLEATKKVEKMLSNINIFLSAIPVAQDIPGSGQFKQGATDVAAGATEFGVGTVAGSNLGEAAGEAVRTAINKGGNWLDKFVSPIKVPYGEQFMSSMPEGYIPLPSPHHIASQFQPSLTDMLLGEPGDMTQMEIGVPRLNAPTRRGY